MQKRIKKFRKLSKYEHRVTDDISKLEFLFGINNQKTHFKSKSPVSKKSSNKHFENSKSPRRLFFSNITRVNEENINTLYKIFHKKF